MFSRLTEGDSNQYDSKCVCPPVAEAHFNSVHYSCVYINIFLTGDLFVHTQCWKLTFAFSDEKPCWSHV